MKPILLPIFRHLFTALTFCLLLSSCCKDNSQHFTIDDSASGMEWKGYQKDGSCNNGTIKVTGDLIAGTNDEITAGEINLPVSSLININQPSDELKKKLIRHLQSADFFDMVNYPDITFKITTLKPDKYIPATYHAAGTLRLLGKTNQINFPVKINMKGNKLEVTGETNIDRTLWGMHYAACRNAAEGLYVKPEIAVQFRIVAFKKDSLIHK